MKFFTRYSVFVLVVFLGTLQIGCGGESKWAYSKPFDTVGIEYGKRMFGRQSLIDGAREVLQEEVSNGVISGVDGSKLWITRANWQSLGRDGQMSLLSNFATDNCGCYEPESWNAEIYDSRNDELLASISSNGLRALWTNSGIAPDVVDNVGPVDTKSPMSDAERLESLREVLKLASVTIAGMVELEGRVDNSTKIKWFRRLHPAVFVTARATSISGEDHPRGGTHETTRIVFNPETAGITPIPGERFRAFVTPLGDQIYQGVSYPIYASPSESEETKRVIDECRRLSAEISALGSDQPEPREKEIVENIEVQAPSAPTPVTPPEPFPAVDNGLANSYRRESPHTPQQGTGNSTSWTTASRSPQVSKSLNQDQVTIPRQPSPTPKYSTDQNGNVFFAGGGSAAENVPEWVPIYTNGQFQNPSSMSMGDVVIGGFEIVTPDQIDSVHAHYRSELEDQGFEVSSGSSGSIKASNSRTKRRVDVELSEINSGTLIVVSFSRGR